MPAPWRKINKSLVCPLSWSVHCNFTGDGKCNERGWACTPPPQRGFDIGRVYTIEIETFFVYTELCLASSKILTPHPPLHPASVSSPRNKSGGTPSPGGEGGGGSIFWKTQDIGLASYFSNNLSTPHPHQPGLILPS